MNEPFHQLRQKPWGHEVLYTPGDAERVGKILYLNAGSRISFQYHTEKEETIALLSGEALLWIREKDGEEIQKIPMLNQSGYTIYPGVAHRLEAITESVFLETSSPEKGTTVRLEDDYQRPNETF